MTERRRGAIEQVREIARDGTALAGSVAVISAILDSDSILRVSAGLAVLCGVTALTTTLVLRRERHDPAISLPRRIGVLAALAGFAWVGYALGHGGDAGDRVLPIASAPGTPTVMSAKISSEITLFPGVAELIRLEVRTVPAGAVIQVRCHSSRGDCPFRQRQLAVTRAEPYVSLMSLTRPLRLLRDRTQLRASGPRM